MSDRNFEPGLYGQPTEITIPDHLANRKVDNNNLSSARVLFTEQIDRINLPQSNATVHDGIFNEALDTGVRYEHSYTDPLTNEVLVAPAVGILSRAGGTY